MRMIIAECSVVYSGRGDTKMGKALRSILIKDDGAVSIHNDVGNKPLNYMGKGNVFTISKNDDTEIWRFETRKEYIEITIHKIIQDFSHSIDPGLVLLERDGTEDDLQEWLFNNPDCIAENLIPIQREYSTSAGPIDLMFKDNYDNLIGVEVKRIAMLGAVDQCSRYLEALREQESYPVSVILAALDVRPKTVALAEKRGIPYVILPSSWNDKNQQNFKSSNVVSYESLF